jgi:hypothetical protein
VVIISITGGKEGTGKTLIAVGKKIAECCSRGIPLVYGIPEWRQNFVNHAGSIWEAVIARSA